MARKSTRALWTEAINTNGRSKVMDRELELKQKKSYTGLVLGVDPSLRCTGLALIEFEKGYPKRILESISIKVPHKIPFAQALAQISESITDIMKRYTIRHVALEQTIYVQNFQTAQILGAARGAAIAAAVLSGAEVFEYPPLRVKQAVVGSGRAGKEQLAKTVRGLLNDSQILPSDEADAAGVAICHAMTYDLN